MAWQTDGADVTAQDLSLDELLASRAKLSLASGRSRSVRSAFGENAGRQRGPGSELESIGPYQEGDDPRHIDWSATARSGRPQVRRFLLQSQRPLMMLIDLRPSMFFGTARQQLARTACLAAAAISWQTDRERRPAGIACFGAGSILSLRPTVGRLTRPRLMHALIEKYGEGQRNALAARSTTDAAAGLRGLLEQFPIHTDLLVISDFSQLGEHFDASMQAYLRHTANALVVEDPFVRRPATDQTGSYPSGSMSSDAIRVYSLPRLSESVRADRTNQWRRRLRSRLHQAGFAGLSFCFPGDLDRGQFR